MRIPENKIKILQSKKGATVHYDDGDLCIESKSYRITLNWNAGPLKKVRIPVKKRFWLLGLFSITTRLFRLGIHIVEVSPSKTFLIIIAEKKIFRYSIPDGTLEKIAMVPVGRRPLRGGICIHKEFLYLGEYWGNPERQPVHLHKIDLRNKQTSKLFSFPAGSVRHIHTAERDPYEGGIWVSTGDSDKESQTHVVDPLTGMNRCLGKGSQKWRSVGFAFLKDSVIWGTDNHAGANSLYKFTRKSGEIKKVATTVGPIYYHKELSCGAVLFGTAMEKGEGEQDGFSRLYVYDPSGTGSATELVAYKKDYFNAKLFGYGTIEFSSGKRADDCFWLVKRGLVGGHRSQLMRIT